MLDRERVGGYYYYYAYRHRYHYGDYYGDSDGNGRDGNDSAAPGAQRASKRGWVQDVVDRVTSLLG